MTPLNPPFCPPSNRLLAALPAADLAWLRPQLEPVELEQHQILHASEGMMGLPLLLGSDSSAVEAMVQAAGTMLRLEAGAFRRALGESPALNTLLLRYVLAFQQQVTQTAACNGNHAWINAWRGGC